MLNESPAPSREITAHDHSGTRAPHRPQRGPRHPPQEIAALLAMNFLSFNLHRHCLPTHLAAHLPQPRFPHSPASL